MVDRAAPTPPGGSSAPRPPSAAADAPPHGRPDASGPPPHGARAARTRGFTLFSVRGVPVRIDLSWFVIAGLIAYTYGDRMATGIAALADAGPVTIVTAALAAAVLFFASVLAHEIGHAFTSLDRSIPVIGITMFMLGGVTESTREARSARDEFVIVGVGPFISLVLAAAFGLFYTVVADLPAIAAVVGYMAWTNLALALFNVLPGYPLDGGRLLRSVLWLVTGRPHQATRWAARVGQGFAAMIMLGAIWWFLDAPLFGPPWLRLVTAVLVSVGPWGALIGYFLFRGATEARQSASLREHLAGRRVRDVMGTAPPVLSPDASLAEVADLLGTKPSLLWPVGQPVRAVVRLEDLDRVPEDRWRETPLLAVAAPARGRTVEAETDLDRAVQRMVEVPGHQLIVTSAGRVVGLLTESLVVPHDD